MIAEKILGRGGTCGLPPESENYLKMCHTVERINARRHIHKDGSLKPKGIKGLIKAREPPKNPQGVLCLLP